MDIFLGITALGLFLAAAVLCIKPLISQFNNKSDLINIKQREGDFEKDSPMRFIIVTFIVSRIFIYVFAYIINISNGIEAGFWNSMYGIWVKSDAPHYLGIAQHFYRTVGDPRFHIVFFPLYPLIVAAINPLVCSYFASSLIVSNACLFAACIYLYKLAMLEGLGEKRAKLSVLLMLVFPATFFCQGPFSESLFMLLSVMTLYYARKRSFITAGVCAMLAAFTRSLGVLLAVPILIESLSGEKVKSVKDFIKRAWPAALSALGTLAYLFINKLVTGDFFTFLKYQSQHWYQKFGNFVNTVIYLTGNVKNNVFQAAYPLWIPQLIAIFIVLFIILLGAKKLRGTHTAYLLVYFFAAIAPTWLLSAPRYLMAAMPIYLVLPLLCTKKWHAAVLCCVSVVLMLFLGAAFLMGGPVY